MAGSENINKEQHKNSDESLAFHSNAIREFVEEKTGKPGTKGLVDESTARMSDDQNRLITEHNRQD